MEWVLDISVFNFSFFGKLVFCISLFNCVGFSDVGLSVVGFSNIGLPGIGSVSYTHLDVYKRQEMYRFGRGLYVRSSAWEDDFYLLQRKYGRGIYSHDTALYLLGYSEMCIRDRGDLFLWKQP